MDNPGKADSQPQKKTSRTKLILFAVAGLVGVCVICVVFGTILNSTPSGKASSTARAALTNAQAVVLSATWTASPIPSDTPIPPPTGTPKPTDTPAPTNTPQPTDTPEPTITPTKPPEPVILKGKGDQVVDVNKWSGPALIKISNTGGSNFIVENYDANGERIDLLVNEIGPYDGTLPLDFMASDETSRLSIKSSGSWEIQVLPLASIRTETIPGKIEGKGSDVILITGGTPDLLKVDASTADSNLIIYSYGSERNLIVNEIAPYTGTVILGSDTAILSIIATGPWSLEITTR